MALMGGKGGGGGGAGAGAGAGVSPGAGDVKKASYYVWFLGAAEARGLRGEGLLLPAILHLERRALDLEPFKVTLQVSSKGVKIVQVVCARGKQQTIKHFLPHSSLTSAARRGDVVGLVLLLYNPLTGCPIHVHAYRCDSERTAEVLCTQLQALINRPDNQKKLADIERRLQLKSEGGRAGGMLGGGARGPAHKGGMGPDSSLGSASEAEAEGGAGSTSSEERERGAVATLYDSLAQELKMKLKAGKSPILLPPRDYDTVHRQKGNLSGIEARRCLNQSIVGVNATATATSGAQGTPATAAHTAAPGSRAPRKPLTSSAGSSGIGSDLAPSPDHDYPRQDNHSTSEEEWAESTAYLMHEAYDPSPPRRARSPHYDPPFEYGAAAREAREPRETREYRDPARHSYRDSSFERRYRPQSPQRADKSHKYDKYNKPEEFDRVERVDKYDKNRYAKQDDFDRIDKYDKIESYEKEKSDKFNRFDKLDKYDDHHRSRKYDMKLNRSMDRIDERHLSSDIIETRPRRTEEREYTPKRTLQRGASEGSLKINDVSPKERFNVAKEKFMNLERQRFNKELEQQMAIRRSIIERNNRATSPPDEDQRPHEFERRREEYDRKRSDYNRKRDIEREEYLKRREEIEREVERPRREMDRLPRVGRKVLPDITHKRFDHHDEFDKPDRKYRERDRRVEEDEIIEPVIEDRLRRDYNDRQRAFSRSRLVEEQRRSYYDREFRDLGERQAAKFRHSYAEPIPRGRLPMAPVTPY